jgi:chemotaxis response regulator CheB
MMPLLAPASATPSVLIVNDSAVARAVLAAAIQADGGFRLLGQAYGGQEGIAAARRLRPALVLLDMHMPDLNGVEVTRRIMAACPTRILITSATIRRNSTYVFDALKAGALDYTRTPRLQARPGETVNREVLLAAGEGLLRKMRTVLCLPLPSPGAAPRPGPPAAPAMPPTSAPSPAAAPRVLAVGSSTGGPTALATLFGALPRGLAVVSLISQHIDRDFSDGLAQWLGQETGHPVAVARQGDYPAAGRVYLAEGGRRNLILGPGGRLQYEPAGEAVYAPNIDRLFGSVATQAGPRACGVILTGLGDDGTAGLALIKSAGGRVLVQDPATAVVDGMPGAPIRRGIVAAGQPLPELARLIARWAAGF